MLHSLQLHAAAATWRQRMASLLHHVHAWPQRLVGTQFCHRCSCKFLSHSNQRGGVAPPTPPSCWQKTLARAGAAFGFSSKIQHWQSSQGASLFFLSSHRFGKNPWNNLSRSPSTGRLSCSWDWVTAYIFVWIRRVSITCCIKLQILVGEDDKSMPHSAWLHKCGSVQERSASRHVHLRERGNAADTRNREIASFWRATKGS